MKTNTHLFRNIAIIGVFLILALLAGSFSWLTAQPAPGKERGQAREVSLPVGVSILSAQQREGITVEQLSATTVAEDGVVAVYPERPSGLAQSARTWGELLIGIHPEVTHVDFTPIFATGSFLGIELTASAHERLASVLLVTDLTTEETWRGQNLLAEEANEAFAPLLRQSAKAGQLPLPHPAASEARSLIDRGLISVMFTTQGLEVPLPGTEEVMVIDYDTAPLTLTGRELAQSLTAGDEFIGLPNPPPATPRVGETITFPSDRDIDCARAKCVALTFDDGPVPGTNTVLDMLAAEGVPATFFVLGSQVPRHPHIIARMVAEGHVVGNHTWLHPSLPQLTRKEVRSQVRRTAQALVEAGAPEPVLFRPPYGAMSDMVRAELGALGYATILWDVDTLDWEVRDTDQIVKNALKDARDGGIILLHDIHQTTIDAVPEIIRQLHEEGFTLVTVPELLGGEVTIGKVYRHNR